LNVRTVAVYSEADANSMHVQLADEPFASAKAAAAESYLRIDRIISAAEVADVTRFIPATVFFRKHAFRRGLRELQHSFYRPKSATMQALADKAVSRGTAKKAGVPLRQGRKASLKRNGRPWPSPNHRYPVNDQSHCRRRRTRDACGA